MSDRSLIELVDSSQYRSTQMKLFILAVERTFEKISEGVNIEEFHRIVQKLPVLEQKQKKIFKLHSILKQGIMDCSMAEFNEMIEQENFDEKFMTLKELIDANNSHSDKQKADAWRPPHNVPDHIRSHVMKVKMEQKSNLEQYVQEKEESVKNLIDAVKTLRDKAQEKDNYLKDLNDKVIDMNRDWQAVLKSLK